MSYYGEDCSMEHDYPEHLQKIDDIINARVEELLVKKVADIDSVRKKQAEYKEILANKNKAISDSAEALREARQEVSRIKGNAYIEINNIKSSTVFDYFDGWRDVDKAYYIESVVVYMRCPVCDGKETIEAEVNGVKVNAGCPICNPTGRGAHSSVYDLPNYNQYMVKSTDLKNDVFLFANPATKQVYPVTHLRWDSNKMLDLTTAFKSEKEAQDEADKRTEGSKLLAIKNFNYHLKQKGMEDYTIQ